MTTKDLVKQIFRYVVYANVLFNHCCDFSCTVYTHLGITYLLLWHVLNVPAPPKVKFCIVFRMLVSHQVSVQMEVCGRSGISLKICRNQTAISVWVKLRHNVTLSAGAKVDKSSLIEHHVFLHLLFFCVSAP